MEDCKPNTFCAVIYTKYGHHNKRADKFNQKYPFDNKSGQADETASAVGTVGLTLGITPTLGIASKLILILSMFFGRVGGMTLIYAAFGANKRQVAKLPTDTIAVG